MQSAISRILTPGHFVMHDAFSDLRNSIYNDLGLSQDTLNAGNTAINDPGLQKAALGLIPTTTQGTAASAAIPNFASVVKANPLPYIFVGILLSFGIYFVIKKAR